MNRRIRFNFLYPPKKFKRNKGSSKKDQFLMLQIKYGKISPYSRAHFLFSCFSLTLFFSPT